MSNPNPYDSPEAAGKPVADDQSEQPCPECGSRSVKKIKWTLWGGALGPKMFHHVQCLNCSSKFNSKTGQSNSTVITIYVTISILIGLAVGILIPLLLRG